MKLRFPTDVSKPQPSEKIGKLCKLYKSVGILGKRKGESFQVIFVQVHHDHYTGRSLRRYAVAPLQNILKFSLYSASLTIFAMPMLPSLMLSKNLVSGLPRFTFPKTIPVMRSHPSPLILITWPTNESFCLSIPSYRHGFCPSLPTTHSLVRISTHLIRRSQR